MATDFSRGGLEALDSLRMSDVHDVDYWIRKFACTREELFEAVRALAPLLRDAHEEPQQESAGASDEKTAVREEWEQKIFSRRQFRDRRMAQQSDDRAIPMDRRQGGRREA